MKRSLLASLILISTLGSVQAAESADPMENLIARSSAPAKIAFLLPAKNSPLDRYVRIAANGLLAANYASVNPAEVILVRPGSSGSVTEQLNIAAANGAMVAVGPLAKARVEELAREPFLPLPVISLNQLSLTKSEPMTAEEYELAKQKQAEFALQRQQEKAEEAQKLAQAQQKASRMKQKNDTPADPAVSIVTEKIPGLILAEDREVPATKQVPRIFPHDLLMMGLSLEQDARYIAQLAHQSLPSKTESGRKPQILVIDTESPSDKRIADAYIDELIKLDSHPDRLTIDVKDIGRLSSFFKLVVKKDQQQEEEPLIDQEIDPIGWRQQQLKLRKEEAEYRAKAALAEPPYHAILLALDAGNASLIRSRLPLRSRIWGTSDIYPGNPNTDTRAQTLTYDLKQVTFIESPFILNFDPEAVEAKYKVPAPVGPNEMRLFSLGIDSYAVAMAVLHGETEIKLEGETGSISFNREHSPLVQRLQQPAMVIEGKILQMTPAEAIAYQVLPPGKDTKTFTPAVRATEGTAISTEP